MLVEAKVQRLGQRMASYKEIIALGRDPVRVRAVARRLLASVEDWTEWERDFLEGLVAEYGSDGLSAPQREKLAELRRGAEYVFEVEELDVGSLIEKCWPSGCSATKCCCRSRRSLYSDPLVWHGLARHST
jgi:hypothetical protein